MKKTVRLSVGYLMVLPFFIFSYVFIFLTGRKRAVQIWGPIVSKYIQWIAELVFVPRIKDSNQFDVFIVKMKRTAQRMRLLCDIKIAYQDNDKIVLNYMNCPHCEALIKLGLPEIASYACNSDWDIAKKNINKWDFERNTQIGDGDEFCDHTYIRKQG